MTKSNDNNSVFVERIKQQRKLCADVQHSAVHLICYLYAKHTKYIYRHSKLQQKITQKYKKE